MIHTMCDCDYYYGYDYDLDYDYDHCYYVYKYAICVCCLSMCAHFSFKLLPPPSQGLPGWNVSQPTPGNGQKMTKHK